MWFYVVIAVSNYSVTLEVHILKGCRMLILIVYPCYDEFWHTGRTFSLFCLWHDFVVSGMGGETCAHPLQNKGVSFWECWNEPNTIEAYDFLKNERDAEVSDLVLIVVFYSKNEMLS